MRHALASPGPIDPDATRRLVAQVYGGESLAEARPASLLDMVLPPDGVVAAAVFGEAAVLCAREIALDRPSQLSRAVLDAMPGTEHRLHAMHSVVDWCAFAVWQRGTLVRSLSISPDSGVLENIGVPLAFEEPYWAGQRALEEDPAFDDPYPLPFHPLELGEEALDAFYGFVLEGMPAPDSWDPEDVPLLTFDRR